MAVLLPISTSFSFEKQLLSVFLGQMLGNGIHKLPNHSFCFQVAQTLAWTVRLITCIESYYCQVYAKYFLIFSSQKSLAIVLLFHITVEVTET